MDTSETVSMKLESEASMTHTTPETRTFGELLRQCSKELLAERCTFCRTFHPRYVITFQKRKDSLQVPGLLALLEETDEGKKDLLTFVEFDGTTFSNPKNHRPFATMREQVYTALR
jgi:hypothetical protein